MNCRTLKNGRMWPILDFDRNYMYWCHDMRCKAATDRGHMLRIIEKASENSIVLRHSANVFHKALAHVKEGVTHFHVEREDGEDYDLAYIKNMDIFLPQEKENILTSCGGMPIHPEFLDYDEEDEENLCLEFIRQFKRAEFECVDEYTIASAKVFLRYSDSEVLFQDERARWFLPDSEKLTIVEQFEKKRPDQTLRVTPSPMELGVSEGEYSYLGSVVAFQNMFFWQVLTEGWKSSEIKYAETVIARTTGIGGILAHMTRVSKAFATRGWTAYLSPGCTRYPDEILSKYFKIRNKPEGASEDNTVLMDNYSIFSITWFFNQHQANFDETIMSDTLRENIDEYADAVLNGKKTLGILARGTDYTLLRIGDNRIHASVPQMVPTIRRWMREGNYEQIFLATEDADIYEAMRSEFPQNLIVIAQERHSMAQLKEYGSNLLADLEVKLNTGSEYEEKLEDTTVNYFYALVILSKCDGFLCSGQCNGYEVVQSFNHGRFEKSYMFSVGVTGEPGTEDWKALRPLGAGVFARAAYPEYKAFYITFCFQMDELVSEAAIRDAWEKTMKVYPYFKSAVVKRNRVYYITENPLDFVIIRTEDVIEPGTAAGNFHSVTICYHDRKLVFYIDHVITDGTACRFVLETFFYYYYCTLDQISYPVPEGVRTIQDGPAADEQTNAYDMVPAIDPQKAVSLGAETGAVFQYPERPEEGTDLTWDNCGGYCISVPSAEFMDYAHFVGGSPSSVLFQLAIQSLQRMNPENRLRYNVITPVSVRGVMGNPGSLLHQVVHCLYTCEADMVLGDDKNMELNLGYRESLKAFSAPENIKTMCGIYHGIADGIKQAIGANMLDRAMQGRKTMPVSFFSSYVGKIAAGEYGSRIQIDRMHAMPGPGCMFYMLEVGGRFDIFMYLGAKTDRYARDMAEHMKELGMKQSVFMPVSQK